MMESLTESHFHLLIICGVVVYAFYSSFKNLIKARAIEDTPTSKIRSASQGYVELNGLGQLYENAPVVSPLTASPCLWYSYKVERYQKSGKSSSWKKIEGHTSSRYFVLDDNTGECVINPSTADVTTIWDNTWYGSQRIPTAKSKNSGAFSRVAFSLLGGRYRYTEKLIKENDGLYALGLFQTIGVPSATEQKKEKMAEILGQWKQDYDFLLKHFDKNDDGKIDMNEWEEARKVAAKKADYLMVKDQDHSPVHILARSPVKRHPYLLSNKSPKELAKKYRLYAFGMAALFLAAVCVAVYIAYQLFFQP